MGKKVVHVCDNCKATEFPDPAIDSSFNAYPIGWARFRITINGGRLAELLLCFPCVDAVNNALVQRAKQ